MIFKNRVFFFLVLVWFGTQNTALAQDRYVPGEILVSLEPGVDISSFWGVLKEQQQNTWILKEQVCSAPFAVLRLQTALSDSALQHAVQHLRSVPGIRHWQYNHFVQERVTAPDPYGQPLHALFPNDPLFGSQWHLNNTGQLNGTPGADLGMINAWETTTGGVTPLGDTVVVAIIDGGLCPYCEDWGGNLWHNYDEIPGDGIDNDGNGYFDDFQGWNVNAQDDNIIGYSTGHGTAVSGVIAAQGNDQLGITGMLWNTKLMFIAGLSGNLTTESQILGAYEYVYKSRKAYNETFGEKGAFVVSVNCSFGINYAAPYQSPLWCDMLEQLGEIGVVPVAATANGSWNVDEVGDMPSTCPTDYLITVTSVNNKDEKVASAAYGETSVDMAAFGENIYTLSPQLPGYEYRSGTSFAAPQVAAAVGLLYSAPCHNLTALAKSHPDAASLWVKNLILGAVKPLPSLNQITVTGGRLQVDDLLDHYEAQCQSCPTPYWLTVGAINTHSASVEWVESSIFESVDLRWRALPDTTWTVVQQVSAPFALENLLTCHVYEFSLRAQCGATGESVWSVPVQFTTDGCCLPPINISAQSDSAEVATVVWDSVTAADQYAVRYRAVNTVTWTMIDNVSGNGALLTDLVGCTNYEVQVSSLCAGQITGYSPSFFFKTKGCGACYDAVYCTSKGENATEEWIESVSVGNLWSHYSIGNQGYQNFSGDSTIPVLEIYPGMVVNATIVPGFASNTFLEMFRIFVDINLDGDFDDADEMVFNPGFAHNGSITAPFVVPQFFNTGVSRMRVSMKFKAPGTLFLPQPCEWFEYGQVEDYCVTLSQLLSPAGALDSSEAYPVQAAPNPFQDRLYLTVPPNQPDLLFQIMDTNGRILQQGPTTGAGTYRQISGLANLPAGLYLLRLLGSEDRPLPVIRVVKGH